MRPNEAEKLANQLLPYILRKVAPRLNGIGAQASSSAPADVLTALLAQDGAGSDLDADKLDGEHGTAYVLVASTNYVDLTDGGTTTLHRHGAQAVATKSANYTLTSADQVVVFTATATALLPAATGSGQTYRIICRAGTLTIDGNGAETIKGETTQTLAPGEDLLITDVAGGLWE